MITNLGVPEAEAVKISSPKFWSTIKAALPEGLTPMSPLITKLGTLVERYLLVESQRISALTAGEPLSKVTVASSVSLETLSELISQSSVVVEPAVRTPEIKPVVTVSA